MQRRLLPNPTFSHLLGENDKHDNSIGKQQTFTRAKNTSTRRSCILLSPLLFLLALWIGATFYFFANQTIHGPIHDDNTAADSSNNLHTLKDVAGLARNKNKLLRAMEGNTPKNEGRTYYQFTGNQSIDPKNQPSNNSNDNMINIPPLPIHHQQQKQQQQQQLLSRNPTIQITSSVKGNLGPPSVLHQDPPGSDWLKDRWQAASDMGGTAIPGSHWIMLDFSGMLPTTTNNAVHVTKVILDWETAYANNYRIEGRLTPPSSASMSKMHGGRNSNTNEEDEKDWCVLYDGAIDIDTHNGGGGSSSSNKQFSMTINNELQQQPHRVVEEYGQSPGVKQKMALHIVHTIDWNRNKEEEEGTNLLRKEGDGDMNTIRSSGSCHELRYMRIFIRKPARGWGVSLWQVDVFGTRV